MRRLMDPFALKSQEFWSVQMMMFKEKLIDLMLSDESGLLIQELSGFIQNNIPTSN